MNQKDTDTTTTNTNTSQHDIVRLGPHSTLCVIYTILGIVTVAAVALLDNGLDNAGLAVTVVLHLISSAIIIRALGNGDRRKIAKCIRVQHSMLFGEGSVCFRREIHSVEAKRIPIAWRLAVVASVLIPILHQVLLFAVPRGIIENASAYYIKHAWMPESPTGLAFTNRVKANYGGGGGRSGGGP
jgi:hypothetical protein